MRARMEIENGRRRNQRALVSRSCGILFVGNGTSFAPDESSDPAISPDYLARQV